MLAALLALVLYAISLGGTYVYDDMYIVREDPRVQEGKWREAWTTDYNRGGTDNLYRPLITTSYILEWQLHGDRPWVFHLVNWFLHAAVCAAVAQLGLILAGRAVGFIAGALFAVHPIHVEAVANIVGRAELVCALAMVGAMLIYLRGPLTGRRVIAIVVCFLVAVGSKEQGMLLPFILLALHWVRRGWVGAIPREDAARPRRLNGDKNAQYLTLSLCLLLSGYIVLRENVLHLKFYWDRSFLDWTNQPMIRSTGIDLCLMPLVLLGRYLALLVWPITLSPDYGGSMIGWHVNPHDPYLYLGAATVVVFTVAFFYAIMRRRFVLLFCLIGLALTYGLVSNFVTIIGTNFGERLMYLPSVFFLVIVAMMLRGRAMIPVVVILVMLGSVRTVTYAAEWNDRLSFYQYCVDHNPRSVRLYMLLADEQTKRGDLKSAEATVAAGRALEPEYWDIYVQSAVVAEKLGKYQQADEFLGKAMKLRPSVGIAKLRNALGAKLKAHQN